MQKPNPWGCFGNPGICLECAQGQESLKGLPCATHGTNRAQTSGNVSPTVNLCPPHPTCGTKVRAQRDVPEGKKKSQLYIYIYCSNDYHALQAWWGGPMLYRRLTSDSIMTIYYQGMFFLSLFFLEFVFLSVRFISCEDGTSWYDKNATRNDD